MKVVYLHQYFKTPQEGGAVRSYYLAKSLVDDGNEVEMITAHNAKEYEFKVVDGIRVHYLPVYYHNRLGFVGRVISFLKFMYMAYHKVTSIRNVDLCYATSTPLSIGWVALRLKSKHNIPYYFEVRDLWPEAPVQMGVLTNRWLINYLYGFEKKVYQNASKLIAHSPGIRESIESKVPGRYASLLPNMADCDFFAVYGKSDDLLNKYKVKDKFVVAYTGALGKVNNLKSVVEVAKQCKASLPQVQFLIAGDGGEVPYLRTELQKYALENVDYLGHLDKVQVREVLSISDVSLISFAEAKVLETNSPNKFFDGIASGKLIAINTHGWIKDIIETKQCGFYFAPDEASSFVEKLQKYIEDPVLLLQAKTNARRLAEHYFSKAEVSRSFLRLFDGSASMDTVISSVYTLIA